MHLNQSGHNNERPPLTRMNECKEESNRMNGEWRRQNEEEVTRDIFEISKNWWMHKNNTGAQSKIHENIVMKPICHNLWNNQILYEIKESNSRREMETTVVMQKFYYIVLRKQCS